jgi:uncharacterized zinc-type alcohol dehydrogenase-like protein
MEGETLTLAQPLQPPTSNAESIETLCMACTDPSCNFQPIKLQRRAVGPNDVLIDMKYCGVCHSDVHKAANHNKGLGETNYPCVPGHELAGLCVAVGSAVTKVKVGDQVGVGCMVDSCLECPKCLAGEEQQCVKKNVGTYQGEDKFGRAAVFPKGPFSTFA